MLIEVDEYKNKILGYDPENSEDFHRESAKLADRDFIECLKSRKYKRIIFMAGGTASGKTEFAHSYLHKKDQLVYDGTLKNFDGFKIKLQNIKRYDKNNVRPKVVLVIPKDWIRAFEVFARRPRKMKVPTFFETQIKSRLTVAKILIHTKIRVEIYVSEVKEGTDKLSYIRLNIHPTRKTVAKRLVGTAQYMMDIAKKNGIEINVDFDSM